VFHRRTHALPPPVVVIVVVTEIPGH